MDWRKVLPVTNTAYTYFLGFLRSENASTEFTKEVKSIVDELNVNKEWRLQNMTLLMRDQEKFEEGIGKTTALMKSLLSNGRIDDAKKATEDRAFFDQLCEEYKL